MGRQELAIKTVNRAGVDIGAGQAVLAADDAQMVNDGRTIVKLENTTAGALTATFVTPATILSGPALTIEDQGYEVAAGAGTVRYIGPFPGDIFNQTDGRLWIDTAADGLTMTAIKIAL